MNKMILDVYETPQEFFDYARPDDEKAMFARLSGSAHNYKKTTDGTTFNGKQSKVYDKFMKHDVKKEATIIADFINDIDVQQFDEVKWQFAKRLTEGDEVDVDMYLDGQERCWDGCRKRSREKKVVRVYVNYGGNCSRSREEMSIPGAIAATLCEILEAAGVGVEIWGCTYVKEVDVDVRTDLFQLLRVKSADEFADLGMINYILGDSHVYRNTAFRTWCRKLAEQNLDTDGGLGYSGDITEDMIAEKDDGKSDGIIFVPKIYDVEEAKAWLKRTIKERSEQKK